MEQSIEEPMSAFDHYQRGRQLKQVPMYDKALEAFQEAAKDPRYAGKAHVQMALCFRSMARYDEAVAAFRHAMVVDTFSSKELARILYLQGQTLESLGRYAEALEAYGWARKEDPSIQDVTPRIKHLLAGGRGPLPPRRPASQSVVGGLLNLGRQLTPHVLGLLGQASKSLSEYADRPGTAGGSRHQSPSVRDMGHQHGQRELTLTRDGPSAVRDRKTDKRQHVRVATHSPSKGRRFAGAVLRNSVWPSPRSVRACSGRSRSYAEDRHRSGSKSRTGLRVRPRDGLWLLPCSGSFRPIRANVNPDHEHWLEAGVRWS